MTRTPTGKRCRLYNGRVRALIGLIPHCSSEGVCSGKVQGGGLTPPSLPSHRVTAHFCIRTGVGAYYQQVGQGQCDPKTVPISCNSGRPLVPGITFQGTNITLPLTAEDLDAVHASPRCRMLWSGRDEIILARLLESPRYFRSGCGNTYMVTMAPWTWSLIIVSWDLAMLGRVRHPTVIMKTGQILTQHL